MTSTRVDVELRLVLQREVTALEPVGDVGEQRDSTALLDRAERSVDLDAGAEPLRAVHRDVGRVEQFALACARVSG